MRIRTDSRSLSPLLVALLLGATGAAQKTTAPVADQPEAVGEDPETPPPPRFAWVEDFFVRKDQRPIGSTHGCVCTDSQGRIYANTDSEEAVLVFGKDGVLLRSWGAEYRGGLHGMTLRKEGEEEFLYLCHTSRHETLKTTLDGKPLWVLGWPEASGIYAKESEYHPTSVAVSQDGRLFVADGYGKSWIHSYDQERRLSKSFGGPGAEPGKLKTPHGISIDKRSGKEQLLVCDRENHRLQWFSLDGEFVREVKEGMKRPCNVAHLSDGMIAVADLVGRVTILDKDDRPILVLGDSAPGNQQATNQVPPQAWQQDRFFAPHSVCADAQGSLYVMDWNVHGRLTKLARLP